MSDRDERILDIAGRATGAGSKVVVTLDSPSVPEALGRALAEQLRRYGPAAVVFWGAPEAYVLGHVVARELGVDVLPAYEDQGLLSLSRPPADGSELVAVDVEWSDYPGLPPLIRTVAGAGARVVAAAAVLQPSQWFDSEGLPLHVLESAPERENIGDRV